MHSLVTRGARGEEDAFEFNKDAGMYVCKAEHMANGKKAESGKGQNKNARVRYLFDVETCKVCPFREGCYKEGAKTKSYYVTLKSHEHTEQAAFQNTEEFKHLAKFRYKIEAKKSELKHRHGYDVASSTGLFGLRLQGATAIFAVNLKRTIKLLSEKE